MAWRAARDARHRLIEIIERLGRCVPVESSIDSPATPVSTAQRDIVGDPRVVGIAVLEIGVTGKVGRAHKLAKMREHHVARDVAVRQADRIREPEWSWPAP